MPMNRQLSAYLDLMRVVCAAVVVLSHLGHGHLVGGYLWPFTFFGNEAVMTFFVLSGFVIAFVTDQREQTLAVYAASRLARLYSVILPAMLLTVLLDAVGQSINAESYLNSHATTGDGKVAGYLLSIFMLNQSWGLDQHFGSDGAYWSIPYEFWYYFIFGSVMLLKGWRRAVFALAGATIAGPKILFLLPVWLLGVGVYYLLKRKPAVQFGLMSAIGSMALLAVMLWIDYSSLGKARFLDITPEPALEVPDRFMHCCSHLWHVPGCIVAEWVFCVDCTAFVFIFRLHAGVVFIPPAGDWRHQCHRQQHWPFKLYIGCDDHCAVCGSSDVWLPV